MNTNTQLSKEQLDQIKEEVALNKKKLIEQETHFREVFDGVMVELKTNFDSKKSFVSHTKTFVESYSPKSTDELAGLCSKGVINIKKNESFVESVSKTTELKIGVLNNTFCTMDDSLSKTIDVVIASEHISHDDTYWLLKFNSFLKDSKSGQFTENLNLFWHQPFDQNPDAVAFVERLGETFKGCPDVLNVWIDDAGSRELITFLLTEHRMLAVATVPVFMGALVSLYDSNQLKAILEAAKQHAINANLKISSSVESFSSPYLSPAIVTLMNTNSAPVVISTTAPKELSTAGSLGTSGCWTWKHSVATGTGIFALSSAIFVSFKVLWGLGTKPAISLFSVEGAFAAFEKFTTKRLK